MSRGRISRRLAGALAQLVYREITVQSDADLEQGPVVLVSNHFGGLSDAILAVDATPRMPRVVARDLIWKVPVVGQLMTLAGAIPVHRKEDSGSGAERNDAMFRSCYEALAADDMILIFPEGVTQDVPHIAEVKTGAARIALGAAATGVSGIRIVPLGLHYEDKSGFRTRALVRVGEAIDLDAWSASVGSRDAADQETVTALTALITARLKAAAPDYPDWDAAHSYEQAADVLLHDIDPDAAPTRYGDVALVAGALSEQDEDASVLEAGHEYRDLLTSSRSGDLGVAAAAGRAVTGRRRWWWDAILAIILLPYALAGLSLWFLPWLAVQVVKRLPLGAAERATFVPGTALLAFGVEWGVIIWQAGDAQGWFGYALGILLPPFFLTAFLLVLERTAAGWHKLRSVRLGRRADRRRLVAARRAVSKANEEVLWTTSGT